MVYCTSYDWRDAIRITCEENTVLLLWTDWVTVPFMVGVVAVRTACEEKKTLLLSYERKGSLYVV